MMDGLLRKLYMIHLREDFEFEEESVLKVAASSEEAREDWLANFGVGSFGEADRAEEEHEYLMGVTR